MRCGILPGLKKRLWMMAKGEVTQGKRLGPWDRQRTDLLFFFFIIANVYVLGVWGVSKKERKKRGSEGRKRV